MGEDLISFGAWVRLRRQALVLGREDLAARVGVAEVTVRKIEADERRPSEQVASLLAEHLQLAPAERETFVQVARGALPVDHLPPPILGRQESKAPPPDATLPAGTVTFLFTDVEGSTRLWEQRPDAMRRALARHDALLRQAVETHGGRVFKTVGDAVCAAFPSAPGALAAALAGQRALRSEPWPGLPEPLRVRMAVHTGTADPDGGDYLGPTLNRAARLLAAGHGGQVLLSLAAQELVREHLPDGARLLDMGRHRLRDLSQPEQIAQLVAPGLPDTFPPLRTLDARPGNLPPQLTEIVGRRQEIADLSAQLAAGARLLTLTGPGGAGKTRLALQAAAEAAEMFPDGAWFVDLAPVSDPQQVAAAAAKALGVPESPEATPREQLLRWLGPKRLLLVLDNYEQVVDAAPLVAEVLRAAPGVRALVTSRVPLRVEGEREVPVAPLALPADVALSAEELAQYEAVRLFIARAIAVRPGFAVTNTNAPAVAAICVKLDGLPLAIELAAARVRLFTPDQLLARLATARLQTLTGGRRDVPARQQTIRAAIEWSYHLLTAEEQALFARLGVFVGGWDLAAAEGVCGDEALDVLAGLEGLVAHNLVRRVEGGDGPRFALLETIREYALERLAARGEREEMQRRHAEHFANLAEQAEPRLRSGEQLEWLARLDAEADNRGAALAWTLEGGGDATAGLRLAGALGYYWLLRSQFVEAGRWAPAVERLALAWYDGWKAGDSPGDPALPRVYARAARSVADYFDTMRDVDRSKRLFHAGRELARAAGDAWLATRLALEADWLIPDASEREDMLTEAYAQADLLGDPWLRSLARHTQGLLSVRHDSGAVRECLREAIALARATGDRNRLHLALYHAGHLEMQHSSEMSVARAYLEEALALANDLGSPLMRAYGHQGLARLAEWEGNYRVARETFEHVIAIEEALGKPEGIACSLRDIAMLAFDQGRCGEALRAIRQATELIGQIRNERELCLYLSQRAQICVRAGAYEEGERYAAEVRRLAATLDLPFEHAEALFSHVRCRTAVGDMVGARALLTESEAAVERVAGANHQSFLRVSLLVAVGVVALFEGSSADAIRTFRAALTTAGSESGYHPSNKAEIRSLLAHALVAAGEHDGALAEVAAALPHYRRIEAPLGTAWSLADLAWVAANRGDHGRAARWWGAAAALREECEAPLWPFTQPAYDRLLAACREALGDDAFDAAWRAGGALTWEQAVDEALARLEEAAAAHREESHP